jgi:Coenzyme PQQ synthesis protein D (PqqD)
MPIESDNDAAALVPHEHVIFTDLDGVEGVLVDLNTKQYYRLNETASLIWQRLTTGTPVDDIAREMTEVYDVTIDRAQASVMAAVRRFKDQRLLSARRPGD